MKNVLIAVLIFRMAWAATLLVGTSYIVFWLGYSGWWWLLTVLLLASTTEVNSSEKS